MIFLAIGTVLALLFILFLIRGKQYDYMFDGLSGDDFPLSSIYGAGIAMQEMKFARLPNKLGTKLRSNTRLIYTRKYSEYYTRTIWAQALSMGMLLAAICFLLAGIMPDMAGMLGLLGVVMAVLPGYYFINHVNEQVKNRMEACEKAFPDAISKLALIVNSGVILRDAWHMVAYGNTGVFYELMQQSCESMKNGRSDIEAIGEFGYLTNSEDIKKFTSALIQSIERGGGELPSFLSNQSRELWAHHRQYMLQKGEQSASALLMPIALMFFGVMMIVISAALQSFSL